MTSSAAANQSDSILGRLICPECESHVDCTLVCRSCGQQYPRLASIAVLVHNPPAHVEHWRRQLGLIAEQGRESKCALDVQAGQAGLGGAAQARLHGLARAVGDQVDEVVRVLGPVLGGPLPHGKENGLPRGVLDYKGYLFRDWAWSEGHHEENQRALAAIQRVTMGRPLGQTLVLGAGACRLAYDLHLNCGATETAVVDIDPYLLVIAEAVIRGDSVSLTESSANVAESDRICRRWILSTPNGPLQDDAFHFFLADGTDPPFQIQTFDTVVTPWFIDQVPTHLEAFLATVHQLVVPGGRWINHGPLIYRPDGMPLARWHTREEIFGMAGAAGFEFGVGSWESESRPYLQSPLTGRGRIEMVLTWVADRG